MPRSSSAVIQNSFVGGLKTEFTGLNFPENSVTETDNCVYDRVGRVTRRPGFDLEQGATQAVINRTGSAVSTYLWRNVSGDGTINLYVVQVGGTLFFYDASSGASALSGNKLSTSVTLSTFTPSGAPSPNTTECQFADGHGFLFVFHPYLEPFYISYTVASQTVVATQISILVRDFAGIVENVPDTDRPITLTDNHRYNLGNQGWRSGYNLTSSTSTLIGTGSKTFTVNLSQTATPIRVGDNVRIFSTAGHVNAMAGIVTSYSGTTLIVLVKGISGSGTLTDWNITVDPNDIVSWNDVTKLGNYPSNCDVWWAYKNASDVFDPNTTFGNVNLGNNPAPKGHYIASAFNIDRSVLSGIAGFTAVSTGGVRPATGAFFQGRVFYSGVNFAGYNHNIYFSQIIENNRTERFSHCYQESDPTAEDLFDLLPSDGGVIVIQGAGTILKLFSIKGALLVFATNGVWMITGSSGIGFSASDYTVAKISSVKCISATSFVDVLGVPYWWTADGVFTVTVDAQYGVRADAVPLTHTTVAAYFDAIPLTSKLYARGVFHPTDFVIQWVFRSASASTVEQNYEFDTVLNYNTITQAWYPWSVSASTEKINAIVLVDGQGGTINTNQVVRGADTVVDASSNNVITFSIATSVIIPQFKYLVSAPSGATYNFSFADCTDTTYTDWAAVVPVDYVSSFTTGYAVHGDAQRKFQANYVFVFCDNTTPTGYSIQGIWNFANTGASGYLTSRQRHSQLEVVSLDGDNFDVTYRRHKIRGNGLSLQLKFASTAGQPFSIIGWSKWETVDQHA